MNTIDTQVHELLDQYKYVGIGEAVCLTTGRTIKEVYQGSITSKQLDEAGTPFADLTLTAKEVKAQFGTRMNLQHIQLNTWFTPVELITLQVNQIPGVENKNKVVEKLLNSLRHGSPEGSKRRSRGDLLTCQVMVCVLQDYLGNSKEGRLTKHATTQTWGVQRYHEDFIKRMKSLFNMTIALSTLKVCLLKLEDAGLIETMTVKSYRYVDKRGKTHHLRNAKFYRVRPSKLLMLLSNETWENRRNMMLEIRKEIQDKSDRPLIPFSKLNRQTLRMLIFLDGVSWRREQRYFNPGFVKEASDYKRDVTGLKAVSLFASIAEKKPETSHPTGKVISITTNTNEIGMPLTPSGDGGKISFSSAGGLMDCDEIVSRCGVHPTSPADDPEEVTFDSSNPVIEPSIAVASVPLPASTTDSTHTRNGHVPVGSADKPKPPQINQSHNSGAVTTSIDGRKLMRWEVSTFMETEAKLLAMARGEAPQPKMVWEDYLDKVKEAERDLAYIKPGPAHDLLVGCEVGIDPHAWYMESAYKRYVAKAAGEAVEVSTVVASLDVPTLTDMIASGQHDTETMVAHIQSWAGYQLRMHKTDLIYEEARKKNKKPRFAKPKLTVFKKPREPQIWATRKRIFPQLRANQSR